MKKLKASLTDLEKRLKENSSKMVVSSESGPIGIGIIKEIIRVLDAQQAEIDQLKVMVADAGRATA